MLTYISEPFKALLQKNQLDTFEKIWAYEVKWFEEPNERRGGWSGVGRIELAQADGSMLGAFLKKQDKHCRTSLLHPADGVPTFQREFEMMRYLTGQHIGAPEVLFFGRNPNNLETTLLTKELAGFVPLEQLTEALFENGRPSLTKQQPIIQAVAQFARQLHNAKVQHRSFYPKHIFVNNQNASAPRVATIDLEKSRFQRLSLLRTIMDLSVLNRHAKYWSRTARLQFYKQYLGVKILNGYQKWLLKQIVKRSSRSKNNRTLKKGYTG